MTGARQVGTADTSGPRRRSFATDRIDERAQTVDLDLDDIAIG